MGFTTSLRDGGEGAPLMLIGNRLPSMMQSTVVSAACAHAHAHRALLIQATSGDGVLLFCDDQWLVADATPSQVSMGLGGGTVEGLKFLRLAPASADPDTVAGLLSTVEVHEIHETKRREAAAAHKKRDRQEAELERARKAEIVRRFTMREANLRELAKREILVRRLTVFLKWCASITAGLFLLFVGLSMTPDLVREKVAVVAYIGLAGVATLVIVWMARASQNGEIFRLKQAIK